MEKVINVLYEIEEKANTILERSNKEKTRLYEKMNIDIEHLKAEIKKSTDQQLSILKSNMEKEILEERFILLDNCNKQLSDMEKNFNDNHDALVDKVFQRIIAI